MRAETKGTTPNMASSSSLLAAAAASSAAAAACTSGPRPFPPPVMVAAGGRWRRLWQPRRRRGDGGRAPCLPARLARPGPARPSVRPPEISSAPSWLELSSFLLTLAAGADMLEGRKEGREQERGEGEERAREREAVRGWGPSRSLASERGSLESSASSFSPRGLLRPSLAPLSAPGLSGQRGGGGGGAWAPLTRSPHSQSLRLLLLLLLLARGEPALRTRRKALPFFPSLTPPPSRGRHRHRAVAGRMRGALPPPSSKCAREGVLRNRRKAVSPPSLSGAPYTSKRLRKSQSPLSVCVRAYIYI